MHITFAPRDILQIDDARIIFRNFEGRADRYNREGDRNFCVVIPDQETANALLDRGWNVKIKPPRDEDDEPFRYLKVKVSYRNYAPKVYLITGDKVNELDIGSIKTLDEIEIDSVDLDVGPYDWTRDDGDSGRSAYLNSIHVVQKLDRFAARYRDDI